MVLRILDDEIKRLTTVGQLECVEVTTKMPTINKFGQKNKEYMSTKINQQYCPMTRR